MNKKLTQRAISLALCIVFCLLPVLAVPVDAATVNYVYSGQYVYNWGTREETATFLSPMAEEFYEDNNVTYDELVALSGSSKLTSVPSSALYKKLQTLMKNNHTHETNYGETRYQYQYTDCQQSGQWKSGSISSFYSGNPIGPAWDSGSTWNREHTWPNSKGDASGNGENDIMMLRPTATSENGSRGNKAYGKSGGYYNPNSESGGKYDVRGDVARIMLFVYCRWGNTDSMWGSGGVIESREVLLEWVEADPVDTWELGRNDATESITGTRNVFVDYPELIFVLFGADIPANMTTPSGNARCEHTETILTGVVVATCSVEGYTGDTRCKSCNTKLEAGEVIPKVPHTFSSEVTPPSCTEDGFTFYICSVCDHMEEDDYVDALGHDMGPWTTVKEGSCTEPGEKQRECSRCGFVETEIVEKAHKYESVVTAPSCTEQGYTTHTCTVCGDSYVDSYQEKVGHSMGQWTTVREATCTEDGEKQRACGSCDYVETEIIEKGHKYESVVTAPSCTEQGYTTHTCSTCGDSYVDSQQEKLGHDMGEWVVTKVPTEEMNGEERSDCSRCDYLETREVEFRDNALKLEGEAFADVDTVWINGAPYPVTIKGEDRFVVPPVEGDFELVTYTYHVGDANDVHTQYPSGMKVYTVRDGKITHIPELDNILQYSGSSIRIAGKKGIRMITSLTKTAKSALTGKGLAGYKLLEYGTTLCFASEIPEGDALVLGKPYARSNYAYKKGVADPVFATTKDLMQYTNVLVGFSLDQCKDDIAMRPYIILEDANGEQVTLYGGTIYRSIGYIAYQNRSVFKPKTASYNYVWEIIHHVYGDKYDADYKG